MNFVYGKATWIKFSKLSNITKERLGYVYSDLWGPTQRESLGGGRYFIAFIDDCSRKVWVYILKNKNDALGKFKEWKKMVEVQTEKKLKKLRIDNGLEFINFEFD